MIKLSNIAKTGELMSADVMILNNFQTFEVAYDLQSHKITKNTLGKPDIYSSMAIAKLLRLSLLDDNKIPKSAIASF